MIYFTSKEMCIQCFLPGICLHGTLRCKSDQSSWAVMEMGFRNQWKLKFERWMGTKVGRISPGDFSASINKLNVVFSKMINSKIYRNSICSKRKRKKQARTCREPFMKEEH